MLQRDRQRQRERGTAGGGGAGALTAEYLVVAGGGGGGSSAHNSHAGGGAGAGGYRSSVTGESSGGGASAESALSIALGTPYTVTVGSGGASVTSGSSSTFGSVVSTGGGHGGTLGNQAENGGSGGGAFTNPSTNTVGLGTSGQGFAGGSNTTSAAYRSGGGGGAGAVGTNGADQATAGNGGTGVASLITGASIYRAGGGGGGASNSALAGDGGLGGGGDGAETGAGAGSAGAVNTGGGGGGGGESSSGAGGAGGSGVVIIRVPSTVVAEFSAGVVYNYIPLDDFNVYEITAAGVSDTVTFSQGAVTTVSESLRFNDDDSANLSRTPASAGDRKTWTWSAWVKIGNMPSTFSFLFEGASTGSYRAALFFVNGGQLRFFSAQGGNVTTNGYYRDPSAWYHIVVALDAAKSSLKIYVNGTEQETVTGTPIANVNHAINDVVGHYIGKTIVNPYFFDGYLSDVYFIDGAALDPSRFGKQDADGIWQPISYTGSYGTNGFHLDFADNSTVAALGTDTSGNGNDWTPSGITTDDQVSDTPSVNYCTLNPLNKLIVVGAGASPTFSDGNLNVNGNNQDAVGTFGVSSGKWYYEVTQQDSGAFTNGVGWYREGTSEESIYRDDGNFRFDGTEAAYGASWQSSGDIIGIALDLDNTTISFYKNGVSQGNAKTNLSAGTYIPLIYCRLPSNLTANFGQSAFTYTPPTGFVALNSSNLPAPTITDGKAHFQPALYTGNGTTQAIGGLEFQPDFVWIKNRSAADDHKLLDAVRGATEEIESNTTGAEVTNSDGLTAFNSNGFTVGADLEYNTSGENFVAWNWNAGGSTVTNTDGTITSQVRANTDAGISIVSYSSGVINSTIGHGLGVAPDIIITKSRTGTQNWAVYSSYLGKDKVLILSLTNAVVSSSGFWGAAPPDSSVFGVGSPGAGNNLGDMIAYCFAGVDGFSKFGSYTGNGSADGPFVYTGFRPAFVMIKCATAGGTGFDWIMHDTKRSSYNLSDTQLIANSSVIENRDSGGSSTAGFGWDILSNGFKLRDSSGGRNASGGTYIYMAFAENPFKTARAR